MANSCASTPPRITARRCGTIRSACRRRSRPTKRILIVDDEESIRLLLKRILESIPGLEVILADGGDAALGLAAKQSYDLILLDLLMPGVGGIEVLGRIRKESANRKTPVIIVSVMADAPTKIACESLGVADYIVKPIQRAAVTASVQRVIGR